MATDAVTIELFGIPRARAGRSEVVVAATTAREALTALSVVCPALGGLCRPDGRLAPQFLLSLDLRTQTWAQNGRKTPVSRHKSRDGRCVRAAESTWILRISGAGDGNRIEVRSLGSFYTAIVRRPLDSVRRHYAQERREKVR